MKKILLTRVFIIALTVFGQIILSFSPGFGGEFTQSTIILTKDPASGESQEVFSGFDKIYALVTLSGLEPGKYKADINWIDPTGNINQYTPLSFTIQSQSSYTFYSWLQLMKNGPFKSGLTGKLFDGEYLGKWELNIFVNNTMLKKATFEIR
jgi:hypothetical protein